MSWSLQLRNGDLALGQARYGTVTGHTKLTQDLRCHLLERMGTDPTHPSFGSTLDGGRLEDGTEIPSLIGRMDFNRVILEVEAEIRRIERAHQDRQLARIESDKFTYGRPTLLPSEILVAVSDIQFAQVADTLMVRVTLQTGNETEQTIDVAVGTA
jgi:hypothetical protein